MSIFEKLNLTKQVPTKNEKPETEKQSTFIVLDCHSDELYGIIDKRDDVLSCEGASVGDHIFSINNSTDIEEILTIKRDSENPGREIKKYLQDKGYEPGKMPARASRRY